MAIDAIAFEVIHDIESFRALQPEWDDLWHRANGEYFQSFAYCDSSLEAEKGTGVRHQLHVVVGRRQGRLVVLWPWQTFWRSCWKYATPLTPANRSPSDILVAPEHDVDEIVESAWRAAKKATRADVFELWRVRSDSPLLRCMTREAWIRRASEEPTPYAVMRDQQDWEAFCRSRPGRKSTRPQFIDRRLRKHGSVKIEIVDAADSRLPALIDWFVLHKREWAQHKDIESQWTFSEVSRKFWNNLLANVSYETQAFRVFVLTLDDVTVAVNIVAVRATCAYLVAHTYDLAHSKVAPSTVLIDDCVKWAFDNRLDFDFGPGDQQYKSFWTAGGTYTTSSFLAISTWWGRAGYEAKMAIKRLRARPVRKAEDQQAPAGIPANATSELN
ncbi:GNAT family N-acetyltransferase [Paraburkholderia fungorum]|uniref:GNAT family N-acetyltransferase n=1 Tax=Paraburkholderia fungorum TaxID=134537 RepID=UPI0038BCFF7A